MIASNSRLASEAGVEILRRGGNAVDAAVATGFALAVTYPTAGNIGGGGFMVIRLADGRSAAMDYREVAPLAATRNMYLDPAGEPTDKSQVGHLAVGVPGAVAGMAEALARYGTLPLADVMAPAIRLAEAGFPVDSTLHLSLRSDSAKLVRYAGAGLFYPGGRPLAPGATLVQADLARTLRRIAERGAQEFYTGETADLLVAEMRRGGGIITKADLAGYRPIAREPLRTTYRGHTVLGMPPVSSGGTTSFGILHMLETRDTLPAFGSAAYAHLLGEAERRAFVDRNTKLCDPAFCRCPSPSSRARRTRARSPRPSTRRAPRRPRRSPRSATTRTPRTTRGGRGRQRGEHDHHAQPGLRLGRVRAGGGLLPQRRDGRPRRGARTAQRVRPDRGRAERRRAGQAPAVVDDADGRCSTRPGAVLLVVGAAGGRRSSRAPRR
jgi:gamma-glutamyltranspeptidase/glutathione hydrolase